MNQSLMKMILFNNRLVICSARKLRILEHVFYGFVVLTSGGFGYTKKISNEQDASRGLEKITNLCTIVCTDLDHGCFAAPHFFAYICLFRTFLNCIPFCPLSYISGPRNFILFYN